jgi:hypothetical protein
MHRVASPTKRGRGHAKGIHSFGPRKLVDHRTDDLVHLDELERRNQAANYLLLLRGGARGRSAVEAPCGEVMTLDSGQTFEDTQRIRS